MNVCIPISVLKYSRGNLGSSLCGAGTSMRMMPFSGFVPLLLLLLLQLPLLVILLFNPLIVTEPLLRLPLDEPLDSYKVDGSDELQSSQPSFLDDNSGCLWYRSCEFNQTWIGKNSDWPVFKTFCFFYTWVISLEGVRRRLRLVSAAWLINLPRKDVSRLTRRKCSLARQKKLTTMSFPQSNQI